MYNCIVTIRPASYNSWRKKSLTSKANYKAKLRTAFEERYPELKTKALTGDLYGVVYYFHKREKHPDQAVDADNLSKPVWDSLEGLLYEDDEQIKLCFAGCIDLTEYGLNRLKEVSLPEKFVDTIASEPETLYIECGYLDFDLFKFKLTNHANYR